MRKLFQRQLAKATLEPGKVDLNALADLVVAAYQEADRDRCRTDRSLDLMAKEIEHANAQLIDAFNVVPEGLVLLDAKGRYVRWNRRFAELYDPIRDKIAVGASFADSVRVCIEHGHFTDAVGREEAWLAERLLQNSHDQSSSVQHLSGDRWVRVEERRTANGGSIGVRIDITDLKRREESFRLLFEENPIPMWVIEQETHKFLAVNNAAMSHYGYSREQFLAMTTLDIRPPEDRENFLHFMRAGNWTQGSVAWPHCKSDGSRILVTVYTRSIVHAGQPAWLSAIIDVTERTRVEEKLREQKFLTEMAVSNMSQGLVMFDAQHRIVLCNSRYTEIYKMNPEVVRPGCTLYELNKHRKEIGLYTGDPEKRARDILTSVVQGQPWTELITLPDGRHVQKNTRPMPDGGWVATHEDVTERKLADERIKHMAHHDMLTGLPNRALFLERIDTVGMRLESHEEPFTILMLDLDRFKDVNDSLGHPAGDALLSEVAQRLKPILHKTDVLARLGGDEFAILRSGDQEDARALADKIIECFAEPFDIDGSKLVIGVTIGIAFAPADGVEPNELMKKADLALYRKKSEGRNGYCFFDSQMTVDADVRHQLAQDLRNAISNDELEVHYQPIIDVSTRKPCGAEALARWRHPQRGNIPPLQFIPLAEENGLITQLGEWVLQRACTDAASWPPDIKVAINLSPAQFRTANLLDVILCVLVESGLAPERLELEITESVLIDNKVDIMGVIRGLKNLGVSIALDDFGTGYSSLSYLTMFQFDMIKIDKSFTQNMTKRAECAAIISSVLALGRGLEIATTAEGVETEEQFQLLRSLGVDLVQGYLFGRPCPVSQLDFSRIDLGRSAASAA